MCDYYNPDKYILYCDYVQDLDGSYYYRINEKKCQPIPFKGIIRDLIRKYSDALDPNDYYIKYNRLFCTLDGVRYWCIISDFIGEWNIIDDLIQDLEKVGCTDIAYNPGEID